MVNVMFVTLENLMLVCSCRNAFLERLSACHHRNVLMETIGPGVKKNMSNNELKMIL